MLDLVPEGPQPNRMSPELRSRIQFYLDPDPEKGQTVQRSEKLTHKERDTQTNKKNRQSDRIRFYLDPDPVFFLEGRIRFWLFLTVGYGSGLIAHLTLNFLQSRSGS